MGETTGGKNKRQVYERTQPNELSKAISTLGKKVKEKKNHEPVVQYKAFR